MLDLGHGIMVRGGDLAAVIPKWLIEWKDELPEGVPEPSCFVELSSGRVVPCFKPIEELTEFIGKASRGLGTW